MDKMLIPMACHWSGWAGVLVDKILLSARAVGIAELFKIVNIKKNCIFDTFWRFYPLKFSTSFIRFGQIPGDNRNKNNAVRF